MNDFLPALLKRAETASRRDGVYLEQAIEAYLTSKKRRLTAASERGYRDVLKRLAAFYPDKVVTDFEAPHGALLIESFLDHHWADRNPRTWNKSLSVCNDFLKWYVAHGVLERDPLATLQKAKVRPIHRTTFSADQRAAILEANREPRDQIALRLLLDYGIRKGALCGIRLQDFDHDSRRLTVFTKGEKYHVLPIVDDTIWQLLHSLDASPSEYLLPRVVTRKRTPPRRKQLNQIAAHLAHARQALEVAADDEQCARELGQLLASIDDCCRWHTLAVEASSTRVTSYPAEPMGTHGLHLWWYRCLQRAGVVEKGVTSGQRLHKARHTAGQRVLDATGNLKAAQALLGHATIGTTGDVYTGWDEARLEQTLQQVHGGDR